MVFDVSMVTSFCYIHLVVVRFPLLCKHALQLEKELTLAGGERWGRWKFLINQYHILFLNFVNIFGYPLNDSLQ